MFDNRQRNGWRPSYRYQCVDGPPSDWDTEWWYHIPLPMMSVQWFDICVSQKISRGEFIADQVIDHSDWITKLLHDAKFSYDVLGDIIRIHGYLPKSFDGLDVNLEQ